MQCKVEISGVNTSELKVLGGEETARLLGLSNNAVRTRLHRARQALRTSRRVAVPLLELLDRRGLTRRLADDRREISEPR